MAREKRKTETNKSDSNLIDINECYKCYTIPSDDNAFYQCTNCNKKTQTIFKHKDKYDWLCESCLKKLVSKQKVKVILV